MEIKEIIELLKVFQGHQEPVSNLDKEGVSEILVTVRLKAIYKDCFDKFF